MIAAITVTASTDTGLQRARAQTPLPVTGAREDYLRAVLALCSEGRANVRAAENQDSSMLSPFLTANGLSRRPMNSAAATVGDLVDVVPLR